MHTAILLVTHCGIASTMLNIAETIWNRRTPSYIDYIEIPFDADRPLIQEAIDSRLDRLDQGSGVLILTDLVGATPSNLAMASHHQQVAIVSGLNLAMLLRTANYSEQDLATLSLTAVEGGARSVSLIKQAAPGKRRSHA